MHAYTHYAAILVQALKEKEQELEEREEKMLHDQETAQAEAAQTVSEQVTCIELVPVNSVHVKNNARHLSFSSVCYRCRVGRTADEGPGGERN